MRKFLFLIVLCVSFLSARVVEIWPGIDKLGRYKILNHISDYSNKLNYVVIIKDGKKELFPIPTDLTYSLVKKNLVSIASNFAGQDTKFYVDNINLINKYYEEVDRTLNNIKNYTDPFYLLATAFTMIVNMNTGTKKSDETVDKIATIIKSHVSLYIEAILSGGNPKEIIRNALYKPLCDIVVKYYNINPEEHPILNFLISKFADITGDVLYEIIKSKKLIGETNIGVAIFTKVSVEGVWNALGVWLNYIEAMVNAGKIYNIISTIHQLSNNTDELIIHNYVREFIKDYVEKYNMNINLMANDSIYCFEAAYNGQCILPKDIKPHNFFQLFVMYGIKNGYLKNINLDSYLIKDLWLLAHQALFLIENFGNGGNNKIILDIDNNGNVKIDNLSYSLYQLYWMLPLSMKNEVFDNMIAYDVGNNVFIAEAASKRMFYYNPFYFRNLLAGIFNSYEIISSKQHINVTYTLKTIENKNLQGKFVKINGLKKVINYNGFLADKGSPENYQVYEKQIQKFDTIYIPLYKIKLFTKEQQIVINKLIPTGMVSLKPNPLQYLLSFTTFEDIKEVFNKYRYLTNSKLYSEIKLNNLLQSLESSTSYYITKKEFLYFIYELFYDKPNSTNVLPFNKNIPYYVAILYRKGIIKKLDDIDTPLTNIAMFIILYRINNNLQRLQNEIK